LQVRFSLVKVKVLLVSLLDGFRDLTRAGVMAFDFSNLNNVPPPFAPELARPPRVPRMTSLDLA
jgi:hypothetical protein